MKQKEVKELSIDELNEKLLSFQKELSDLKMTHAISQLFNITSLGHFYLIPYGFDTPFLVSWNTFLSIF